MMQIYHVIAKDGREIEILDETSAGVFPYQDIAHMLAKMKIREYTIELGELLND